MRVVLHIDLNSYFATIEQQANPRLRGKPIGVTGGDRMGRTVLGTASVEAKKLGVKTGTPIWKAKALCPEIILVQGDSDKYLECTKKFLNILKDYSPSLEVFSIDESFLELPNASFEQAIEIGIEMKKRIKLKLGEWVTCSIGISYNKLMAKLASDIQKPDGLIVIEDTEAAMWILDRRELDDVCGIGYGIKSRLYKMGVRDFKTLRKMPLESLTSSFKSYGLVLYNMSRGIDYNLVNPFYEKPEVKSIGHRHTLSYNTADPDKIRQVFYKLTELIARRLRAKKLIGKTVSCWVRSADMSGEGKQSTIDFSDDGLDIFNASWKIFLEVWDRTPIRLIGVTISNLKSKNPSNVTFLEDKLKQDKIIKSIDKINNKYGEFMLKRGVLLKVQPMSRKPNPYLSDRRFKI
jgi:DNA polymerase IV